MTPAIEWLERGFDITWSKVAIEQGEFDCAVLAYPTEETSWYTERFRPVQYSQAMYSIKEDDELSARGL